MRGEVKVAIRTLLFRSAFWGAARRTGFSPAKRLYNNWHFAIRCLFLARPSACWYAGNMDTEELLAGIAAGLIVIALLAIVVESIRTGTSGIGGWGEADRTECPPRYWLYSSRSRSWWSPSGCWWPKRSNRRRGKDMVT